MIQNNTSTESTQPNQPVVKPKRRGKLLINALIFIIVLGLTIFSGYQAGIAQRKQTLANAMNQQIGEQFANTLVDIEFGRYEIAKQRLEWIIENDPTFPGAQEKLTEVLVQMNVPTPTPTVPPTPTHDFSGAQEAFSRAQQYISAQDWPNALSALDELRKLDPTYNTSQVDGMYFFALRNQGYDVIIKQGNLEGGIYYLTLAERFGQLDNNAKGIREGARYYLLGASFWELNWEQTVLYFSQIAPGWPSLWDGSMTASERYRIASMRYGDQLFQQERYCDSLVQYTTAQSYSPLDNTAQKNFDEAYLICYPPTATPEPFTATPDVVTITETPTP
jgi:tetratricopeptide (TPR) repeat protein